VRHPTRVSCLRMFDEDERVDLRGRFVIGYCLISDRAG